MFSNHEGQRVPQVQFKAREHDRWTSFSSDDLFAGKKVVAFALPGAFTPTCSSTHLPRYNELEPSFRKHGINSVVCIAVNDPFVMARWADEQGCDRVVMVPDGNASFTEGMGMLVDKSELGFGRRSWRYSMLVDDGVIQKMFIEPDKPDDPFEVSDADTMLHHIDASALPPDQVAIFTRSGCEYCSKAKTLLQQRSIDYAEVTLPNAIRNRVVGALSGRGTVPQVFINGRHVGGLEELERWVPG